MLLESNHTSTLLLSTCHQSKLNYSRIIHYTWMKSKRMYFFFYKWRLFYIFRNTRWPRSFWSSWLQTSTPPPLVLTVLGTDTWISLPPTLSKRSPKMTSIYTTTTTPFSIHCTKPITRRRKIGPLTLEPLSPDPESPSSSWRRRSSAWPFYWRAAEDVPGICFLSCPSPGLQSFRVTLTRPWTNCWSTRPYLSNRVGGRSLTSLIHPGEWRTSWISSLDPLLTVRRETAKIWRSTLNVRCQVLSS